MSVLPQSDAVRSTRPELLPTPEEVNKRILGLWEDVGRMLSRIARLEAKVDGLFRLYDHLDERRPR